MQLRPVTLIGIVISMVTGIALGIVSAARRGRWPDRLLTLGSLEKPWLRAYVHEKALGRIKLNQEVDVTTDSFPDKIYKGRISFISSQAEFTPKTVQTFEERVKLMYRIKVALDNPDNELKPGMPADGVVSLTD